MQLTLVITAYNPARIENACSTPRARKVSLLATLANAGFVSDTCLGAVYELTAVKS